MDDQRFWELVEAARTASNDNIDARPGKLEELLMALDPDEVQDFQDTYDRTLRRANRWDLRGDRNRAAESQMRAGPGR